MIKVMLFACSNSAATAINKGHTILVSVEIFSLFSETAQSLGSFIFTFLKTFEVMPF